MEGCCELPVFTVASCEPGHWPLIIVRSHAIKVSNRAESRQSRLPWLIAHCFIIGAVKKKGCIY